MKQHPLCTDCENPVTPLDLPVPAAVKREWAGLETRRRFLGRSGKVLGWAALAGLLGEMCRLSFADGTELQSTSAEGRNALDLPHFAPKAKRAIYLFMSGGPPQLDLFDYKPTLSAQFNKDMPDSVRGNQQLTGMTAGQAHFPVAPSHWPFRQHGQSGTWVSDLLPYTSQMVDDLTFIKTTTTDAINHEPAIMLMNTGNMNAGKPCMGAWLSYGLGSMNDNVPTFVVLQTKTNPKENNQPVSSRLWSSGFLSSEYAGVCLRSGADPVLYLADPAGVDRDVRRKMLDTVEQINRQTLAEVGDPETNARISQYEMAFRMQSSVPELVDLSKEPQSTWDLYGPEAKQPGTFAYNCLLARRMAERGVRFTQIYKRGWDVHDNVVGVLPVICKETDRGTYALVTDLKRRGLLDDTLVIWAGEFGRTPVSQGNDGRDHNPYGYSIWMAGGGVKPGFIYGATDDIGYHAVEDRMHIHDFHATVLALLGLDHEKLTYRFNGRDFRLTDVAGVAARKIIA